MKFKNKQEQYEWWTEAISKVQNNDKSIRSGCREVGIQFWQYYEWKERVQKFIDQGTVNLSEDEAHRVPRGRSRTVHSFVEMVDTIEMPSKSLSLHFKDYWRLDIPEGFNASALSSILKTLETL